MEASSPCPRRSATSSLVPSLPKHTDISKDQLSFLNQQFRTQEDVLNKAPHLLTALHCHCSDLTSHLLDFQTTLNRRTVSWICRSFSAKTALHNLNLSLQNLSVLTSQRSYTHYLHLGFRSFIDFLFFLLFSEIWVFFFIFWVL